MKKTLIISALATVLVGAAYAADGTSTQQMPPSLPPMMSTGSSTLDAQIKTLRQTYEAQIKALQQQYLTQLKALVGNTAGNRGLRLGEGKRGMMGTTTASGTQMMRGGDDRRGPNASGTQMMRTRPTDQGDNEQEGQGQGRGDRGQMMGQPQVEGASTDNTEGQNQGGFFQQMFRGFFSR